VMKSGLTCPFAIWPKLSITFSHSSQKNMTLVST
jgi:hypothetical protein